jgi:hypothetical protein
MVQIKLVIICFQSILDVVAFFFDELLVKAESSS